MITDKMIAGIPSAATYRKNAAHPTASCTFPEKPAVSLPKKLPSDENKAYWVAVNARLVRLDRYAIPTLPAKPCAKLSAVITPAKTQTSGPAWASARNARLVVA